MLKLLLACDTNAVPLVKKDINLMSAYDKAQTYTRFNWGTE